MNYGKYKEIRNATWQLFLDYGINQLPVKVISLAKTAGIRVIENKHVKELTTNQIGLSILDGNQWYIIFDDTMIDTRIRFTVAHELGHIFLGHALTGGHCARHFERARSEDEQAADMFAARLLAPACVLWELGVKTAVEISNVCQISMEAAKIRQARMTELYKRGKFLKHPLEHNVYEQFKPYIAQQV